jgi:transposase
MAKQIDIEIRESLEYLKTQLAKQPTILRRSRVKALLLIKAGNVVYTRDLAKKLKYDRRTIYNWLKTYQGEGLSGLLRVNSGGNNPSVLSVAVKQGVKEKLSQVDTHITGYVELLDWVQRTYGENIKYNTLYAYCRNVLKSRLKVARKSHYKKDPEATEAFKKNCWKSSTRSDKVLTRPNTLV